MELPAKELYSRGNFFIGFFSMSRKTLFILIAVGVFILDRLTKFGISVWLQPYEVVPMTSFFNLALFFNTGAAFSFLDGAGSWHRWTLSGISFGVSVWLVIWLWRLPKERLLEGVALSLILGGATGNLWDRLTTGIVVDFLDIHFGGYHWPAFNIADSGICVGGVLLVLVWLKEGNSKETGPSRT